MHRVNSSLENFDSSASTVTLLYDPSLSIDEVPFYLDNTPRPSLFDRLVYWHESLSNAGDQRLKFLPLIGSPIPITVILLVYVFVVKLLGPRLMKDRAAFQLKNTLIVYNGLMVVVSTLQFLRGGIYGWFGSYSWTCQPIDYSNSRDGLGMAYTAYVYYISKIVELLDTVFFVLRKKQSQVTTLHVSHHAGMAFLMYGGVKFWAGGHGSFQGFINSFVHIFMYGYYLLAGLGPQFSHLLWWKKYMTQLQLAQFAVIFLHGCQLFFQPNCNYPRVVLYPYLAVCAYFTVMFINFYRKAYMKRRCLASQQMTRSEESETPDRLLPANEQILEETRSHKIPVVGCSAGKEVQSLAHMIDLRKQSREAFRITRNDDSADDSCEEDLLEELSSKKVL